MHDDTIDPHGRTRWTRRLLARGVALLAATFLISALAISSLGRLGMIANLHRLRWAWWRMKSAP